MPRCRLSGSLGDHLEIRRVAKRDGFSLDRRPFAAIVKEDARRYVTLGICILEDGRTECSERFAIWNERINRWQHYGASLVNLAEIAHRASSLKTRIATIATIASCPSAVE
jgi:hypothetical protein